MTSLDKPHPPPLTSLLRLTRSSIKGIFRRADMIVDRAFEVCDSDSHLIGSFRFWCRPFSLVACLENKCVYTLRFSSRLFRTLNNLYFV